MEGLKIKRIKEFILDLVFPRECLGCGNEGSYLCIQCAKAIKLNQAAFCALCHQASENALICPSCRKITDLKAIWVAADYNHKLVQNIIHSLKYNYLEEISRGLAELMGKYLHQNGILNKFNFLPENTILVPVPLSKKRFLSRGFNQSELLAREITRISGFQNVNLLKRVRNTATQIELKRTERQQNVRDAFELDEDYLKYQTKKAILIDDVVTTGSTLKECAFILNQAGFREIYGLVFAQREN